MLHFLVPQHFSTSSFLSCARLIAIALKGLFAKCVGVSVLHTSARARVLLVNRRVNTLLQIALLQLEDGGVGSSWTGEDDSHSLYLEEVPELQRFVQPSTSAEARVSVVGTRTLPLLCLFPTPEDTL